MDLHKLKAFVVVAEELNFRRSAEILGMSQPPLTRLIASLEKELGATLFERTTRTVRLTGAGVLLLREAREIASAVSRIETDIRSVKKNRLGSLKIGFSKTAFLARFPAIVDEFQNRFPQIKVDLLEESSHDIFKRVKDGRLDLAFTEGTFQGENIENYEVSIEEVGVFLPRKHPLAKRKELLFKDLIDETIILHSRREGSEFYSRVSHLLRVLPRRPHIYVKGENESCSALVALGKGVSFTVNGSWSAIPQHTVLIPVKDMSLPIRMIWRDDDASHQLKYFLSLAIEKANVLPQMAQCLVLSNEH